MSGKSAFVALVAVLSMSQVSAAGPQTKPAQPPRKQTPAKPAPKPAPVAAKPEPPAPPPGVRVTTAYTQGAQVSQNTAYLQGARQRVEFPGVVTLEQCDLKQSVLLNTDAKRYRVQPYPEPAPEKTATVDAEAAQLAQVMATAQKPQTRGGVVTFTTNLIDTLERQQLFGLEARRIKTVIVKQASPSACDKSPLRIEVDGWYVDLPQQTGCTRPAAPAPPRPADPAVCTDTIETAVQGDAKLGFPVKLVTATTTGEGNRAETSTTQQEVTALEITPLNRELFDVPSDFTEATSTATPPRRRWKVSRRRSSRPPEQHSATETQRQGGCASVAK